MIQRQLTFGEAVKTVLNKYCCFTGRASRSEYWWWVLATFILSMIIGVLFSFSSNAQSIVMCVVNLALLLPSLGLCVRRLHDIGKSGWWILIGLIPLVGAILLIVWYCQDSNRGPNQYGPEPYLIQM